MQISTVRSRASAHNVPHYVFLCNIYLNTPYPFLSPAPVKPHPVKSPRPPPTHTPPIYASTTPSPAHALFLLSRTSPNMTTMRTPSPSVHSLARLFDTPISTPSVPSKGACDAGSSRASSRAPSRASSHAPLCAPSRASSRASHVSPSSPSTIPQVSTPPSPPTPQPPRRRSKPHPSLRTLPTPRPSTSSTSTSQVTYTSFPSPTQLSHLSIEKLETQIVETRLAGLQADCKTLPELVDSMDRCVGDMEGRREAGRREVAEEKKRREKERREAERRREESEKIWRGVWL